MMGSDSYRTRSSPCHRAGIVNGLERPVAFDSAPAAIVSGPGLEVMLYSSCLSSRVSITACTHGEWSVP